MNENNFKTPEENKKSEQTLKHENNLNTGHTTYSYDPYSKIDSRELKEEIPSTMEETREATLISNLKEKIKNLFK